MDLSSRATLIAATVLVTMVSGSTAGNLTYEDAQAANQRLAGAICLGMAGGVFGLSGSGRPARRAAAGSRPRA